MTPLQGILRQAFRGKDTINCLTAATHERYQSGFSDLRGVHFHMLHDEQFVKWNTGTAPIPSNHTLWENLPPITFDFVLSQNKFGQFQKLAPIANAMNIPLISLEHTLPATQWPKEHIQKLGQLKGNVDVFISDYSRKAWGFPNAVVIPHMVDTDVFTVGNKERKKHILTVANDYIGRDWCLNFSQYKRVTQGLPTRPVGNTPGLSKGTSSLDELVNEYQTSRIFLNTAHVSPIPTSLLEAMSCGSAVVSCNTCAIPEYIQHGENGLLANNDKEMRSYLLLLLQDKELATRLGENARKTIEEKCNKELFLNNWTNLFRSVL